MRRVDRNTVGKPRALTGRNCRGRTELKKAKKYFEDHGKIEGFTFKAYKDDTCKQALNDLFFGKCAYCESQYNTVSPDDIDHYRPKGKVEDDLGHPGYWWLAADWDNLLPSCPDCNRGRTVAHLAEGNRSQSMQYLDRDYINRSFGKGAFFPIAGKRVENKAEGNQADEKPYLLNPCEDQDIEDHIYYHIDNDRQLGCVLVRAKNVPGSTGLLPPMGLSATKRERYQEIEEAARKADLSIRGSLTIQILGLNRIALLQARTKLLLELELLGVMLISAAQVSERVQNAQVGTLEKELGPILKQVVEVAERHQSIILNMIKEKAKPAAPYSHMVRTWIAAFLQRNGLVEE